MPRFAISPIRFLNRNPLAFVVIFLLFMISCALLANLFEYGVETNKVFPGEYRRRDEILERMKEKTRVLEQRIRFLEEDALFRTPLRESYKSDSLRDRQKKFPPVKRLSEADRKRILVTGGSGFVGSHLVDKLLRDGHEVTVADNFFTGRRRNVEHWIGHENFELINHDIIVPLMVEVDQIYHLASPASPIKYMYNPIKTIKTNTIGTLNMLGLAKRVKARFLLTSTSEVYGDPTIHPQHEGYNGNVNPIGPRACYDEGKRVAETMVYAYANQDNVDVRVARIFNTFGPRMHMFDGRVVSNFIMQALQGHPLTVISPGNQTRSFMFISDLVSGLISLMESNVTAPVNLGNPEEHTMMEFANIIQQLTGGKSTIKMMPAKQDDPKRRRPDISRARARLNWMPLVSLEEGLRRTIQYFKKELNSIQSPNSRTA